jgi:hypothetical protein
VKTKDTGNSPEAESPVSSTETTGTTSLTKERMLEKAKKLEERKEKRRKQLQLNREKGGKGGRPVGSKNKLTLLREAVLEKAEHMVLEDWEEVVRNTIDLAKAGDTTCLKILWDRVIPSKRAIDSTEKNKNPEITINISGLEVKRVMDEPVEAEFTEVEDNDG